MVLTIAISLAASSRISTHLHRKKALFVVSIAIVLQNTVAPSTTLASQNASAAFTNALANAGTHWLEVNLTVVNGATAGTVDLQMAQNTVDVLTLTVLAGGYMIIIKT